MEKLAISISSVIGVELSVTDMELPLTDRDLWELDVRLSVTVVELSVISNNNQQLMFYGHLCSPASLNMVKHFIEDHQVGLTEIPGVRSFW